MNNGSHPSRVGRYAIVECVGNGALGPVYAGIDEAIGRRVAVRVGRAGDPRVHQQARLTGQVAHPNVVSVLDLGEDNGSPFAVMELLDGASLGAGDASPRSNERLDVMHADLRRPAGGSRSRRRARRPEARSRLRADDGIVKLIDFGGDGRAVFASPEQSRGVAADRTVRHLFRRRDVSLPADRPRAVRIPRVASPINRSDRRATAPEALSRTLLKAMDKDPHRRQASINHLRAEIEQVRQGRHGDRQRILIAAFDRYRDIEALLAQRRALGRRLGMPSIESECDAKLAQLAAGFPEFARAGLDINEVGDIDPARAAEALTRAAGCFTTTSPPRCRC